MSQGAFPLRNPDTLVYTLCTCCADPGQPIAITTCNHNSTQSFRHALILTASYTHHCLQSSPSHFHSPTNEKRRTMPTRQLVDSPTKLSPIPTPPTTMAAHLEPLSAAQGTQRVVIKLLGRYIDVVGSMFLPPMEEDMTSNCNDGDDSLPE